MFYYKILNVIKKNEIIENIIILSTWNREKHFVEQKGKCRASSTNDQMMAWIRKYVGNRGPSKGLSRALTFSLLGCVNSGRINFNKSKATTVTPFLFAFLFIYLFFFFYHGSVENLLGRKVVALPIQWVRGACVVTSYRTLKYIRVQEVRYVVRSHLTHITRSFIQFCSCFFVSVWLSKYYY